MWELVSNSWWEKKLWRSFRIGSTLEVGRSFWRRDTLEVVRGGRDALEVVRGGRFETWDGSSDTIHDIIKEQGTPEVGLRLTRYPRGRVETW